MEKLNLENTLLCMLNCEPDEFYKKYKKYKKAEKEFKDLYEPFKEGLLQLYKTEKNMPANLLIGGLKLTYISPSVRNIVDSKKLKEEEPELIKKYIKTTNVSATIKLEEE